MDNFEKAYGRLNPQQRQAVDTIEGPVLVIAGPGTGKTQLLTTRIANILHRTDTLPENILCLTFTDSAAHTMRDRLTSIVGQAAYDVTISTYHAFGSELIRRYPEYFTSASDLRPVDDLTMDSVFRSILNKLPYSNPLKHDIFLRDIKTLISDSKRALLAPEDLRTVAKANKAFIDNATELVQDIFDGMVRIDKKAAERFKRLQVASQKLPLKNPLPQVISLGTLWQQQLEEALLDFDQTSKTTALTKWKNNWLAKDVEAKWVVDGHEQIRKLEAAATIYERYLNELTALGLYDYDDMILNALRGLEGNADLRYSLQERYLYILLDEFQDTNQAQLKMVELLTDNPVNEGRPNVLAVGDDDQAIYAFQGANYSHMLTFYEHYRDVLVVPLTQNYRSHKDVLHLAGGVASQIERRLHENFLGTSKTITAANKDLPEKAIIARYEFKTDLSQNTWVAKQIKQLIEQGTPASEIAILAPKHEYLESLVPFMHHEHIAIHYDKRENVLDDPVVGQLITMSRLVMALAERNHALANTLWSQILSFDFWDLSTSLIWQLSWQSSDEHEAWVDVLLQNESTKHIALFFIRLSQLAGIVTLETMLDYLIGVQEVEVKEAGIDNYTSPLYKYYFEPVIRDGHEETQDFWQLLTNLTVLRSRLREFRSHELKPLTLQDFIEFVAAHRAADIKILNTSPYQESTEAVELMTAFKAKGQEYSAVFIVAAIDEIWGSKARNLGSRLSIPENLRFIRYAGATNDERLRLLYVAITRAKTQLYITSFTSDFSGRLMTRLKYLNEHSDERGIISPLLPDGQQQVHIEDQTPPELAELAVYWQQQHYHAINQPALKELLKPRLEHFQLSPTQLNRFLDTTDDGPAKFFMQSLLHFPTAPTVSGEYGSAMHESVEWVHLYFKEHGKLPSYPELAKVFDFKLTAKRLAEPHHQLLLERGKAALEAYLAQRTATISKNDYIEYNFRNEGVFAGSAHLSGKIDKLIVNPQTKNITIVDFKTGKSHGRWAREVKLHFYRQQLYLYKLLVERSHSFAGYVVTDAYLEFIEPDEQGRINELHVDFDTTTMQELEQLLETTWKHIMELNFPDVSNYSKDLKGIEQFQHDLLNKNI